MTKRTKKPTKLTKSQKDAIAITISARTSKGMQAFIVAGAEVLRSRYGFTEEQAAAWATETVELGTLYLKLDNEGERAKVTT